MFNDYEIYMLSKFKQNEMNLNKDNIPKRRKRKTNNDLFKTKSFEMPTCCPSVCC